MDTGNQDRNDYDWEWGDYAHPEIDLINDIVIAVEYVILASLLFLTCFIIFKEVCP